MPSTRSLISDKACCFSQSEHALYGNFIIIASCRALNEEMNGSPQPLVYFHPYEREREVHKCIHPKHFWVSGSKISNVMTKETS